MLIMDQLAEEHNVPLVNIIQIVVVAPQVLVLLVFKVAIVQLVQLHVPLVKLRELPELVEQLVLPGLQPRQAVRHVINQMLPLGIRQVGTLVTIA